MDIVSTTANLQVFQQVMSTEDFLKLDVDVEEIYERRCVASLPVSSIPQKYDNFETITNKFNFDFRFVKFRMIDNHRLLPGCSKTYPILF